MITVLKDIMLECHKISKEHGFWDSDRNFGEAIALIHSELSELTTVLNDSERLSEHVELTEEEEEIADVCIRIFDLAAGMDLPIMGNFDVFNCQPTLFREFVNLSAIYVDKYANELISTIFDGNLNLAHPVLNFDDYCKSLLCCHMYLSEALEHYRCNADKREIGLSLSNVLVIIFAICYINDMDLLGAINVKMDYNRNRPMKHGKQF